MLNKFCSQVTFYNGCWLVINNNVTPWRNIEADSDFNWQTDFPQTQQIALPSSASWEPSPVKNHIFAMFEVPSRSHHSSSTKWTNSFQKDSSKYAKQYLNQYPAIQKSWTDSNLAPDLSNPDRRKKCIRNRVSSVGKTDDKAAKLRNKGVRFEDNGKQFLIFL